MSRSFRSFLRLSHSFRYRSSESSICVHNTPKYGRNLGLQSSSWVFRRSLVTMQVGPQQPGPPNEAEGSENKPSKGNPDGGARFNWKETTFKMAEAALTTFASVFILG